MNNTEHALLERLILHNPDLKLLESKLSNFNIFEAVGMTRQEIRHSYFLAFLLNPLEAHYFGDLFLKQFLIKVLQNLDAPPISAIAVDVANLEDAEVKREYKNIDVLIYSPGEKIVVAIENKIDSDEHDDQLNRYRRDIILPEFPDCRKFLIYLTKEGDKPQSRSPGWHAASYELVSQCIDELCDQHAAQINDEVRSLMTHYSNLIKRHIMSDSEIVQLCRKIYKQHRQALDLIYEHRPDFQSEISDFLQQLIEKDQVHNIVKDDSGKKMIRFAPRKWDGLTFQKICQGWTSSERILLFQFWNVQECLNLDLYIGPGNEAIKHKIWFSKISRGLAPHIVSLSEYRGRSYDGNKARRCEL